MRLFYIYFFIATCLFVGCDNEIEVDYYTERHGVPIRFYTIEPDNLQELDVYIDSCEDELISHGYAYSLPDVVMLTGVGTTTNEGTYLWEEKRCTPKFWGKCITETIQCNWREDEDSFSHAFAWSYVHERFHQMGFDHPVGERFGDPLDTIHKEIHDASSEPAREVD